MTIKVFVFNQNRVLDIIIQDYPVVNEPFDADLILSSQDVIDVQSELISIARALRIPTAVMQHGLFATRAYTGVFDKKLSAYS